MPLPILGVILAGGLARRMGGGDKPLLRVGGRTLLDCVVERLAPQCEAGLVLSANGDPKRFADFPGPVVPDAIAGNPGPLAGILAGLDYAAEHCPQADHVVTVAGDTPFLPIDLVARLLTVREGSGKPIGLAASGGHDHYAIALWPVVLREDLRAALVERGERRLGAFIARHGVAVAEWPVDPVDPFLNINEPADIAVAEAILTDSERASRL